MAANTDNGAKARLDHIPPAFHVRSECDVDDYRHRHQQNMRSIPDARVLHRPISAYSSLDSSTCLSGVWDCSDDRCQSNHHVGLRGHHRQQWTQRLPRSATEARCRVDRKHALKLFGSARRKEKHPVLVCTKAACMFPSSGLWKPTGHRSSALQRVDIAS